MRAARTFAYALVILPAAELAVFIAVALFIGAPATFILLILVSLSGVAVLRHLGQGAVRRLRNEPNGSKVRVGGEIGAAVGAILLIIPGFITGLLGAALIFRRPRQGLLALFRRCFLQRRRPDPGVIDLAPHEWQRLPKAKLTHRESGAAP